MVVVDCDSHVMEPEGLWREYLEPEFRDRAIRIEVKDDVETLLIGEAPMLEGRLAGLGGAHVPRAQLFATNMKYADGCEPASYDPAARISMLDAWRVDKGVLFPTIGILPFPTDDMPLYSAYCRAYNRWQADFYSEAKDRVVPVATINWHDINSAVAELEYCFKLGFRGVFVPPEVVSGVRPGQSHFDSIWALCEEAGLPGCLHVVVRFDPGKSSFSSWFQTTPGATFTFGLGATGQLIPAMASLVTDGVFDRFPRLKIVSVEAGCGYAAYLMDRLDEKHQFFGPLMEKPLAMKPSDYIRRNCYFVAEPEERTIDAMLTLVGEDRILWGSDYPHVDSTLDAPNLIRQSVKDLTPARQHAVLGENAMKVFGF
ncbi:MAG TPA: amidohydrolase family protein [Pseudomonadales bacterium]|nr:amidohydrolase family protein [Pseudomonadales bacterium]